MSYIFNKQIPEIGQKGFIVGSKFLQVKNDFKIPVKGLEFYVPFKENFNDIINDKQGKISGTSYYSIETDEKVGNYLKCTKANASKNNYLYWEDTSSILNYGLNDFCVSFWMRAPRWNEISQGCILSKKYNDTTTGFVFYKDSDYNKIDARIAYENNFFNTIVLVDWTHYLFQVKNGIGYWYTNGLLDSYGTTIGDASYQTNVTLGHHEQWGCTAYFDLVSLRIYNRSLTDREIKILSKEYNN